jgi:methionyl-tRNA formyltransferase
MLKNNLSLVCSISERSHEYLKALTKEKIKPLIIITYQKNPVNKYLKKRIVQLIKTNNIKILDTLQTDINSKKMYKHLINWTKKNVLISLYPGEIIKNKRLLIDKNLLHNHTGMLPNYRGSTSIYYSILKERKIFCTTFIMNRDIDDGKILYLNEYKFPKKKTNIDNYDNKIRAEHFLDFLKGKKSKKIKINKGLYYTIHPILRNLAHKVFNDNLDIR